MRHVLVLLGSGPGVEVEEVAEEVEVRVEDQGLGSAQSFGQDWGLDLAWGVQKSLEGVEGWVEDWDSHLLGPW